MKFAENKQICLTSLMNAAYTPGLKLFNFWEEYFMANHKSAKKRIRRNANRAEINKSRISRIRTFLKRVETAIASGDKGAAQIALKEAQPELMRGVSKGVLHKNTASRKMSRLSAQVKIVGSPS